MRKKIFGILVIVLGFGIALVTGFSNPDLTEMQLLIMFVYRWFGVVLSVLLGTLIIYNADNKK